MSTRARYSILAAGLLGIGATVATVKLTAGERGQEGAVILQAIPPVMAAKRNDKLPALIPEAGAHEKVAVFAGGCFWCMETAFEGKPGISHVTSGFSGGHVKNATYDEVGRGGTGHAEAVRVVYDPKKISYEQLLDLFWHNIDPISANGQFCDRGDMYRSAIYYGDRAEKKLALATRKALEDSGRFSAKIATEIVRAGDFFAAEEYHQDFWKKDPTRYYSYRRGCGRDARLKQIWGAAAPKH